MKPKFGPDPDLYASMSKPYESKEAADAAIERFMVGVKKLREECRIAEVVMLVANHVVIDDKQTMSCQALALGNPDFRAELGAMAFQTYTAPALERAKRLRAMAAAPPEEEEP